MTDEQTAEAVYRKLVQERPKLFYLPHAHDLPPASAYAENDMVLFQRYPDSYLEQWIVQDGLWHCIRT